MDHHIWVFIFGLLGNISSFVVFLSPVPTFYRIIKKKSTEGFQSVPYVVALFSATMWLYYAYLKGDEMLLITINCFGCVIEILYIALYIAYASKKARVITLRLLFVLNFGGFCFLLVLSHFLAKGSTRVKVLGGICVAFSVSVFAAPLSIIRVVIRTKSVEFMPFPLSFFLTISAVTWLLYGISLKDLYVALPNVLGFTFGVVQMGLYLFYKNKNKNNLPEHKGDIVNVDNKLNPISTAPDKKNIVEVQISTEVRNEQENDNKEAIRSTHHDEDKGIDNFIKPQLPVLVKCEA